MSNRYIIETDQWGGGDLIDTKRKPESKNRIVKHATFYYDLENKEELLNRLDDGKIGRSLRIIPYAILVTLLWIGAVSFIMWLFTLIIDPSDLPPTPWFVFALLTLILYVGIFHMMKETAEMEIEIDLEKKRANLRNEDG